MIVAYFPNPAAPYKQLVLTERATFFQNNVVLLKAKDKTIVTSLDNVILQYDGEDLKDQDEAVKNDTL